MGESEVAQLAVAANDSTRPRAGLPAVVALRLLEALERLHVDRARAQGWSWQEIADALG